nr:hypothetical protein [Tanacetum cinerariifolium]
MLWGLITSINVDYAELLWVEFVQAIQTFFTDKANLGSPTKKDRKDKPHVIPYCQFTKLIIYHLGRIHNIHQRSTSLFHLAEEVLRLGNLKFVPKGEKDEVFGMPIPNELISNNIRNSQAHIGGVTIQEQIAKATRPLPVVEGKALKEGSTRPSVQPQDDASANIVHESPSHVDAETGADSDKTTSGGNTKILQIDEDQGKDVDSQVNLKEKTAKLDQGQAGSDPGKNPESRPPIEQEFIEENQARPDPELPVKESLSSSGTHSSMKNLDNAYTFGDQFLNDKSTEDESGKLNMDSEVVSIVTIPIHQGSSLVTPISTPIIDLSLPKTVPATTPTPIFTATSSTSTTTLLLLPPPP